MDESSVSPAAVDLDPLRHTYAEEAIIQVLDARDVSPRRYFIDRGYAVQQKAA